MIKKTYQVLGMSCVVCSNTILDITKEFPGVVEANLNFASETLMMTIEDTFDEVVFKKTIHEAGYEVVSKSKEMRLKISGMSCVVCSKTIEDALLKMPGIMSATVNYASEEASLSCNPEEISFDTIKDMIVDLGYEILEIQKKDYKGKKYSFPLRLWINIGLSLLLLYIAMGPMIGLPIFSWMTIEEHGWIGALIQLGLTLIVMILGRHIFIRGFKNLIKWHPNMDSLVTLGTTAAFLFSLASTITLIRGNQESSMHLYYEAVAVIITLVMLGKTLENISKGKAKDALQKLSDLAPQTAILVDEGGHHEVGVETLRIGDIILVAAGSPIPTDGIVIEGAASVDEAMLTGESLPIDKGIGSQVVGASICLSGYLKVEVTTIDNETILSKMIKLVEEAQNSKAPIARLADEVSGVFVPIVLGISILAGIVWWIVAKDLGFGLQIMVSVLVIACPCSLGLATPIAIIVGTGLGASQGILIKNAQILEETHRVKAVALDKTGTITSGSVEVCRIVSPVVGENELLTLMASLEAKSHHPLAKAIMKDATLKEVKILNVEEFTVYQGLGLAGIVNKTPILVGNASFMKEKRISQEIQEAINEEEKQGRALILCSQGEEVIGFVSLSDTIKESSYEGVKLLKQMGLIVALISGDHEEATRHVAREVGINHYFYGVLPEEKGTILDKLHDEFGKVAMVGDGINDSVALSKSDIGIAMASGAQIAMSSADIVLMKSDLRDVALAIYLSKKTIKNIKENLFWAFGYNIIGIPIAAGILYPFFGLLLNPMIAAFAMAFSSVSVVLNALRLRNLHIKR
ncbi:MAG: heavy metal translocating P-type ATPase [Bacilli bacterium]|nr:heavy metal translocating P-type ATPase [Bacilli bacterium]